MPIVALCGIDGAGKSSTCTDLGTNPRLAHASVVAKRDRRDTDVLCRRFPEAEADEDRVRAGPYATAVRWGHALDFLRFYEEVAVPAQRDTGLVISDRWTICSIAYADVGTSLGEAVAGALSPCRPADLLIYLDIQPELAFRRIQERGDAQANEALPLLELYRAMYGRWLPKMASDVVRFVVDDHTRADVSRLVAETILDRFPPG